MKWLTREWASGELEDAEWESRWREYQSHCTAVLPRLHDGAEMLVQEVNLHDAQVNAFEYTADRKLVVRALIGDLQVGYEHVELTYTEAELRMEPGATIESLQFDDAETEIHYDEIDVEADGRYVHRVLLWPEGGYEVAFATLDAFREKASPNDRR